MNRERYHRIKMYCEKHGLFRQEDKVVLAVSGGADSVFLVYFMKELAKEWSLSLTIAHVNHGIRGEEAKRDEGFCQRLAQECGVDFVVFHGDVPVLAQEKKMSEEEAARWYRYQCLEGYRESAGFDKIAVAHHQNDQAETVLFQMLRGSSLRGAGGIRPRRDCIVRPLLSVRREEIEEELRYSGKSWCEDSTNQEMIYSRNQLRHQVLPQLEREIAQGATAHLAELAEQLQEVYDFVEQETKKSWKSMVRVKQHGLEMQVQDFLELHSVVQRELVLQMMEELSGSRKDITSQHMKTCCQLAAGETGKRISLPYGIQAGKDYDVIWMKKQEPFSVGIEKSQESIQSLKEKNAFLWNHMEDKRKEYDLESSKETRKFIILEKFSIREEKENKWKEVPKNSCTKWFDCARINRMLEFRHPQEGDYFLIGDGKRKKLGRFLIDQKVTRERREQLWVLAMGSHILWIPEMNRVSTGFYVNENTTEVLCASYKH